MRIRCIAAVACAGAAFAQNASATVVYDGRGGWTGSNAAMFAGTEWADDLHMTDAGTLTSFSFAYTQSLSSSATVRFYTNDATNTIYPGAGTLLATFAGIAVSGGGASGTATFPVPAPLQIALPADVWMSVQFNGQALFNLQSGALVGASDVHRTTVPGNGDYNFDWPGNFPFTVEVDPVPTPATASLLVAGAVVGVRRRRV